MCTVTIVPSTQGLVITSSRDEHIDRPRSLKPDVYLDNGNKYLYPKDPKAGGTWFAANEKGRIVVLLNGAFKAHKKSPAFQKSRGLIVLELIKSPNWKVYLEATLLKNVEPFTILVMEQGSLLEFRWDGSKKHFKDLDPKEPHIWSSSTLYDQKATAQRENWFKDYLETLEGNPSSLRDFHLSKNNDLINGLVIDRPSGLRTFSVTQVVNSAEGIIMEHTELSKEDLEIEGRYSKILAKTPPVPIA